jgi:outer membrane protein assembly factor BamB
MFHLWSLMRRHVRALAAAVTVAGSAAILAAAATGQGTIGFWAQYRLGPARAGSNPFETELNISNVKTLKDHRLASMGGIVQGAPAVVDGVAYAFATDARLYAFRVSTGKLLWRRSVGKALKPTETFGLSSPAVGPGDHPRVFVGTPDGKVVAVRAKDGVKMWTSSTGGRIISSPAVVNGVVYIGSDDHHVYAFRASDGRRLWRFATGGAVDSSPAVVGGTVYVGSADQKVYALAAKNGARRWTRRLGGEVSTPAVSGKVVYATSSNGKLYALARANGAVKWSAVDAVKAPISPHAPAVAGGLVFTTGADTTVRAFNASTGTPIWNTGALMEGTSDPAVANGVVYVGTTEDRLNAFDSSTGKKLFGATGSPAPAYFDPVVSSGTVVMGVNPTGAKPHGTLHVYDLP